MKFKAQIIDVFAGPGGLGEGFSAYRDKKGNYPFQIKISVEMEQFAHKTLRLRAFLRHFTQKGLGLPDIYLDYVKGDNKLLAKLLEFRVFEGSEVLQTENNIRDWESLSPESYCPDEYQKAMSTYSDDWIEIETAIKQSFYEARRMTLGPDETDIHQAIHNEIKDNVPTILIGGPPCQAFSTVGRSRRKGHVTNNVVKNGDNPVVWDQDNDGRTWLYKEYIKIINEFTPDVFIMENVRGMLSAKVTGAGGNKVHVWKQIFSDLNKPSNVLSTGDSELEYDIYSLAGDSTFKGDITDLDKLDGKDFVLHAKCFGVPQARERVILLGIKKTISKGLSSNFSTALESLTKNNQTHVRDAIGDLPSLRAGLGKHELVIKDNEPPKRTTIKQTDEAFFWHGILNKKLSLTSSRLLKSRNEHQHKVQQVFELAYSGHSCLIAKKQSFKDVTSIDFESTNDSMDKFTKLDFVRVERESSPRNKKQSVKTLNEWYAPAGSAKLVLNHETRKHMDSDLCRYIFSSSYSLIKPEAGVKPFPRLPELEEVGLDPKGHKNKESFIDRFRTQVWDLPATTVTSHISKDGHYYIHPDPSQMRSLTVREAARIQTFPDNYFFEGPRTAQFVQVGNAVPPLLANKIAGVVFDIFSQNIK